MAGTGDLFIQLGVAVGSLMLSDLPYHGFEFGVCSWLHNQVIIDHRDITSQLYVDLRFLDCLIIRRGNPEAWKETIVVFSTKLQLLVALHPFVRIFVGIDVGVCYLH